MRRMHAVGLGLIALAFLTGALLYDKMPEKMASHWNLSGEVDGYMGRDAGVFFMPVLAAALFGLLAALPKMDPMSDNYEAFRKEYDAFAVLLLGFLYYLYLLTLAYNLGQSFNMLQFLAPAFGILFIFTGGIIGKAKQNWFFGIRTPWTLSSSSVWDKTHKASAKMFKAAGVAAFMGMAFPAAGLAASVAILIAAAVFAIGYSYVEFQREKQAGVGKKKRQAKGA